jgi:hypothetical protein
MLGRGRHLACNLVCLLAAWGLFSAPASAQNSAKPEVDVALVLAVDVSRSMDPEEQELQRQGFVEAFRSPLVHEAIKGGMLGRVAVVYMEWSGVSDQKVVVPWTLIEGAEGALEFSERLSQQPIGRIFQTSISGAIDTGVRLLNEAHVEAMRRVIDVSGDGPNSSGRSPQAARDEAVAKGIVINGLPLMLKRPTGFGDMENLDHYYQDCVIGGAGAFLVPVRERQQFAEAIKTKILREIAGLRGPQIQHAWHSVEPLDLVRRVQEREPMNCGTRGTWNRWQQN